LGWKNPVSVQGVKEARRQSELISTISAKKRGFTEKRDTVKREKGTLLERLSRAKPYIRGREE